MARIRYIKPEFFKDEDIAELKLEFRLAYIGLWCHADKEGKLEYRPKFLKTEIFPYDNYNIEKILDGLAKAKIRTGEPYIVIYEVDGRKYIKILKFLQHQRPHNTEKPSEIPEPTLNNGYLTVKEPLDNEIEGDGKGDGEGKGKCEDRPHKLKFLDFVMLKQQEHEILVSKLGSVVTKNYIERLNNYIGSKGKKYSSHYHTILNWHKKDEDEGKLKQAKSHATVEAANETLAKMERWRRGEE